MAYFSPADFIVKKACSARVYRHPQLRPSFRRKISGGVAKCRLFSQAAILKDTVKVPYFPCPFPQHSNAWPVTQASA